MITKKSSGSTASSVKASVLHTGINTVRTGKYSNMDLLKTSEVVAYVMDGILICSLFICSLVILRQFYLVIASTWGNFLPI